MAISRFQRGGRGVFECRCCERPTRETGRDHGQTQLCEDCFELASIENAFLDSDDRSVEAKTYGDEIRQRVANVARLGGKTECWAELVSWL